MQEVWQNGVPVPLVLFHPAAVQHICSTGSWCGGCHALPALPTCPRRYSEVRPLLKELDKLIEAALERILQPTHGDPISPLLLNSSNATEGLDLDLWNQIPLVLIDEQDKDNPVIVEIFETNQSAAGNQTAAPPAPANVTSEEKKYKLAVKLVRVCC